MRSEHEMMALILDTVRENQRIWAVILNGSRVNLNTIHNRSGKPMILHLSD